MAYINIRYPIYYATLQNEHGLTLKEIEELASRNKVYVGELGKVETLKAQGNTDNQIVNYFTSQGYNSVQMQEVRTYLENRNKADATGKTGKEKLQNTLDTIKNISGTALPILGDLAKIFGIGGNSLNPVIPNLATYKAPTSDGYDTFTVDTSKGEIKSGSAVDIAPPKVGVSSLPFGLTTENLILIVVLLIAVYFFAKSSEKGNYQSSTINSKK